MPKAMQRVTPAASLFFLSGMCRGRTVKTAVSPVSLGILL